MTFWQGARIVILALLAAALTVAALRYARNLRLGAQPEVLRIAISRGDSNDLAILRAFAAESRDRAHRPSIEVIEVDNPREAARGLTSGSHDLAVVRPDIEIPNGASAMLRLRAAPLILVSRKGTDVKHLGDLDGKVVGVEARDASVLDEINTVFAQTQRQPVKPRPLASGELESALSGKKIDIALFTPSLAKDQSGPALVRRLSASGGALLVSAVQPDDVSAMISSLPSIAITESGLPSALRDEDVEEVICAQFLLMARNRLASGAIATVTERLFSMRSAIAKRAGRPAVFSSVAGENLTATAIPLHKGAIEYYEREQKTFVERYSDELWMAIAASGMVSSAFAWALRRVGRRRARHLDNALADIAAFAAAQRHTADLDGLRVHEQEFDALMARVVELARSDTLDEGDLAAVRFACDHARQALDGARMRLASQPQSGVPSQGGTARGV